MLTSRRAPRRCEQILQASGSLCSLWLQAEATRFWICGHLAGPSRANDSRTELTGIWDFAAFVSNLLACSWGPIFLIFIRVALSSLVSRIAHSAYRQLVKQLDGRPHPPLGEMISSPPAIRKKILVKKPPTRRALHPFNP